MSKFNPAASFLLELGWPNLFEKAGQSPFEDRLPYRCKGCQCLVAPADRRKHHSAHKRDEYRRREKEIQRNREAALKKARAARGRRAA